METLELTEPLLLLTDQRPKQTMIRIPFTVPAGHILPEGTEVKDPFKVIVEAGIRWHPEWTEPRVTVNAWRPMAMGDVLGMAGPDVATVYGSFLPEEVNALAVFHGQPVSSFNRVWLDAIRLDSPSKVQEISTFILPEQLGRTVH